MYSKRVARTFYHLSNKNKIVRAFESVWTICNNIPGQNFMSSYFKTGWPDLV